MPDTAADTASPRARRAAATRERLLAVATELVAESGIDGFSLRELARRADYSPGALYRHFPSREAILNELGMRALTSLGEYLERVPAQLASPERVVELGMAYLRFTQECPNDYALAFDGLTDQVPSWAAFVHVAWPFTLVVDEFARGVENGDFAERAGFGPDAMAYGMWSLANGAAALSRRHLAGVTENLRPMQRASLACYVRGLTTR
ncbi:MAG: TetR/AcrR family transcriptional regulator [Coriobacteriia bacterium]